MSARRLMAGEDATPRSSRSTVTRSSAPRSTSAGTYRADRRLGRAGRSRRPVVGRLADGEHLVEVVGELEALDVVRIDLPARQHRPAEPVDHALPVVRADQDDREVADLAGLAERRRLEELVERPEAAGEDHEGARVADEHDLAREEVMEGEPEVDPVVLGLLVRQLDVEPDRRHARLAGPAVGSLHDPRAAARDDR